MLLKFAVVPAVVAAAADGAGLGPEVTLGNVLAAAAPDGGTGALLTVHARGDLATGAALQGAGAGRFAHRAVVGPVPPGTILVGRPR